MEKNIKISNNGNLLNGRLIYNDILKKQPLIICLSGFGGSGSKSSTWKLFLEEIKKEKIDTAILLIDYEGHGYSEGELANLTPLRAVSDLRLFFLKVCTFNFIDSEQVLLYGSSFGGYVSLIYAGLYGGVKGIALKSPVSDYANVRESQLSIQELEKWKLEGIINLDSATSSKYEFYVQSKIIDIYSRVCPFINLPVLIVHGSLDLNVPIAQSIKLEGSLLNSRLEVIEGAGHGYEEADNLNKATHLIINFLKDILK